MTKLRTTIIIINLPRLGAREIKKISSQIAVNIAEIIIVTSSHNSKNLFISRSSLPKHQRYLQQGAQIAAPQSLSKE